MPLNVYLTFEDNCREVFDFYRSVFGGEYLIIQTFGDGPADMGILDSERDRIMHATISIGDSFLMGSDSASSFAPPPTVGDNFSLSYTSSSREEADELFAKLSTDGTVTMPLQETFWGSYFGSCTDKFGINWQLDHELTVE